MANVKSDCKVTKSREQNKTNTFVFYAETEYLRDFLSQSYKKIHLTFNI